MRAGPIVAFFAVVLALSLSTDAQAKNLTMSGIVTDKKSHNPIQGATVTVVGNRANPDTTDSGGSFVLNFTEGVHEGETVRIRVEKPGYKAYEVLIAVSSTIPLQVSLEATGPKIEVSAPHGIAIGGGTVNNPMVNNYSVESKPNRRISAADRVRLIRELSQCKGKVSISAPVSDTPTTRYAMDWYEVLQTAGWEMKDKIVLGYISFGGLPFAGAMIYVQGSPLSPGEEVNLPRTEQLGCLGQAFLEQNVPRGLQRDPKNEDGMIVVQMGPTP
jgi:hypothetical protein